MKPYFVTSDGAVIVFGHVATVSRVCRRDALELRTTGGEVWLYHEDVDAFQEKFKAWLNAQAAPAREPRAFLTEAYQPRAIRTETSHE